MRGKAFFSTWIMTWALITFLSAGVATKTPDAFSVSAYAALVFATADAVPPLAKISFGVALALVLFVATRAKRVPMAACTILALAIPAAFYLCVSILPVSYYPSFAGREFFPGHLAAAAAGSLLPILAFMKSCSRTQR